MTVCKSLRRHRHNQTETLPVKETARREPGGAGDASHANSSPDRRGSAGNQRRRLCRLHEAASVGGLVSQFAAFLFVRFDQQHKELVRQFLGRLVLLSQDHADPLLNLVVRRRRPRPNLKPRPWIGGVCIIAVMKAHGVCPVLPHPCNWATHGARAWFLELCNRNK